MKKGDFGEGVPGRVTYRHLLAASAVMFLILPFVTTFNEFLTKMVENTGIYRFIQNIIVPPLVKMVGAILQALFGVQISASTTSLRLQGGVNAINLYLSWNCIGWQSLILFMLTLVTGLQGQYTRKSKIKCLLLGVEGTFLVNLGRIVLVCLAAFYWGYGSAVIIHDYGGTVILLLYLAGFWHFSLNHVLKRPQRRTPTIPSPPV